VRRSAVLIDRLARRMRTSAIAALEPVGLRPRHLVALTVLRDGGAISQQELASTLQIDRTNLVGLLNELEAEALVVRRRSSEDRRRHVVELTTTGRERLVQAEFALAAVEDEVLGALSGEQREALYDLLQLAAGQGADCAEPAAGC
jgi:MarR family transcriptional regulator, lower aerobic nicotinate degradation pathway regulator